MIDKFKKKGRFVYQYEKHDFIPQYGDIVFYQLSGKPDGDHVGIVIEVKSGFMPDVVVLEGNKSDAVSTRVIRWNDSRIYGYGLPRFK